MTTRPPLSEPLHCGRQPALAAVSAAHDGPVPPALWAAAQHGCAMAWPVLSARADGAVAEAVVRQVVAGLARARRALGAAEAAALARLAAALDASRHAALRWRGEGARVEACAGLAASRAGALNAGAALG